MQKTAVYAKTHQVLFNTNSRSTPYKKRDTLSKKYVGSNPVAFLPLTTVLGPDKFVFITKHSYSA